ncbi:MAG: transglutaminase family protein [Burkholderiaceae bacterium]
MRLLATASITVQCPAPCPSVAMLRPRSGAAQWVIGERYERWPATPAHEYDDVFGNLCQRFTLPAGESRIEVSSEVEVSAEPLVDFSAAFVPVDQLPDYAMLYLLQSRYCPSDKMADRAQAIVGDAAPGYAQVDRITRWINTEHVYRYGVSSETTDALETMEAKAGVCRDFAHVGVALCRSLMIPARVVVGYLHGLDPMDLHAWFEAYVGGKWYPFDATQKEAKGGRIVVAYGRDIADVAFLSNYGALEILKMDVQVKELQ